MALVLLRRKMKGFTLIEVIVALFIFSLIMSSVASIFANTFAGYKAARGVQRDTENAQYAIGIMTKELRTSSIASSSPTMVRFYDYSQDICFSYQIVPNNLVVAKVAPSNPDALETAAAKQSWCRGASVGTPVAVTTGTVTGSFSVVPSNASAPVSVGKVTISLRIAEGTKYAAQLQTSASLRDYGYTGL
jgi:prepilin-type N-terminal cleavage/methylation domain-containing protein